MTTIESSVKRLARSERGQKTCKLLLDFIKSPTVRGLDGENCEAVAALVSQFMLGDGATSCEVIEGLNAVIERNQWVLA